MIRNETEYKQAKLTLEDLEVALADLKQTLAEEDVELFETFAASYLKDIDRLRQEIDEYIGVTLAQKGKAPLWLKLRGENIEYGKTSARILSEWLKKVVDAFRNTITFLVTGKSAGQGAPPKEVMQLSEIDIAAFAPGSLEIAFRLPEESQQELFEKRNFPREALFGLLKTVTWLDSDNPEVELEQEIPDAAEREVLLAEVMTLLPSKGSPVQSVEFSGLFMPKKRKATLKTELQERGTKILTKLKESEQGSEVEIKEEKFIGWIAEVDYAKYPFSFELRDVDDPNNKKLGNFTFDIDLVSKVHLYHVHNKVKVIITGRKGDGLIEALSIEPFQESE